MKSKRKLAANSAHFLQVLNDDLYLFFEPCPSFYLRTGNWGTDDARLPVNLQLKFEKVKIGNNGYLVIDLVFLPALRNKRHIDAWSIIFFEVKLSHHISESSDTTKPSMVVEVWTSKNHFCCLLSSFCFCNMLHICLPNSFYATEFVFVCNH